MSEASARAALFDPARHEPLCSSAWDPGVAQRGIQQIVDATLAQFDDQALWPTHPRDTDLGDAGRPAAALYHGAAGVIWALQHLRERGHARFEVEFGATVAGLLEHNRRFNAASHIDEHSYVLGDPGVLLLQFKLARSPHASQALFDLIEANLDNPTREFLWGSPGTLVAALHMLEATAEARWLTLFRRGIDMLWQQMEPAVGHDDCWLWTQDMYGRKRQYLGAGHGFAGNVFPVVRGARWLPAEQVRSFVQRAARTLAADMLADGPCANWQPVFDAARAGLPSRPLVQDCHGAPGIVCRLADAESPELRALLLRGGELVWAAGPLNKGPGLCHGTAGNGQAFLKLHKMTGDSRWLERARAFAMHALEQTAAQASEHGQHRYSLWTGDLGVALFTAACITGDAAFPTLDVF